MSERFPALAPIAKSYYGELSLCQDDEGLIVAVRRVAFGSGASRRAVERVVSRANRAVGQTHLHIVPTLDVFDEGEVLLVNQYVEGAPLSTLARMLMARPEPSDKKAMARIIVDALAGLEFLAAHDHYQPGGMTPDAIMVCADGRTRLIEPMVQAAFSEVPALARHQSRVCYRAPEQLGDPAEVSERSDVFTMGIMLWELLQKRRLFAGLGYDAIAKQVRAADVPRITGSKPLQQLLEKALALNPEDRFQSASEMRAELKATAPHTDAGEIAKLFENLLGGHPSIQRIREAAAEHTIRMPRRRVPPIRPLSATPSGSFSVEEEGPSSTGRPMDTFPPPMPTEEDLEAPTRQIGRGEIFTETAESEILSIHVGRWLGAAGFARLISVVTLQEKYADDDVLVATYLEDARIISRVKHPNLVPIHDIIDDEDELFVVMDFLDGVSLAHLLRQMDRRKELIPIGVASRIITDVLHGLDAAHNATDDAGESSPVVHRDVCPDSIFVGADGYARVLHFGLERGLERGTATRKRSWRYKAPEQAKGEAISAATDVYGASAVAYHAFTGRRPFRGKGIQSKVVAGDPPEPTKLREELPPKLAEFVLRGMSVDPEERWESAEAMAAAVEGLPGRASHRDVADWLAEVAQRRLDHSQRLKRAVENAPVMLSADELEGPLSVSSAPRESLIDIDLPPGIFDEGAPADAAPSKSEVAPKKASTRSKRPPPKVAPSKKSGSDAEEALPAKAASAKTKPAPKPKAASAPAIQVAPSQAEPALSAAPPANAGRTWLIAAGAAAASALIAVLVMRGGEEGESGSAAPNAPSSVSPPVGAPPKPVADPLSPGPSPPPASTSASSPEPAGSAPVEPAPAAQPSTPAPTPLPATRSSAAWPPVSPKPSAEPPAPAPTTAPVAPVPTRRLPDDI